MVGLASRADVLFIKKQNECDKDDQIIIWRLMEEGTGDKWVYWKWLLSMNMKYMRGRGGHVRKTRFRRDRISFFIAQSWSTQHTFS